MTARRDISVFVNCPFDKTYRRQFEAVVFTIAYCGYDVRSALEVDDSGDVRLEKIIGLIKDSRYSIHDISRVEIDPDTGLPRFNMPLELGAAIGLRASGRAPYDEHGLLILDTERFRYQKFVSDLAGVDIRGHHGKEKDTITAVRDFISSKRQDHIHGTKAIFSAYRLFNKSLPDLAKAQRQSVRSLTYHDRLLHLRVFLEAYR